MKKIAILLLNEKGIETAKLIKSHYNNAQIYGLEDRVSEKDMAFQDTGEMLRQLYNQGVTIIGLCAAGILIRALAPELNNKRNEPPVLVVSDDGSLFVPLLGGLTGANELAKSLAQKLKGQAVITASGSRHYQVQLEAPPETHVLVNKQDAKRITSDILNGKTVRLNGHSNWLEETDLPFTQDGEIEIKVSVFNEQPPENGLLYHPKNVLVEIAEKDTNLDDVIAELAELNIAQAAIASIISEKEDQVGGINEIANTLNVQFHVVENQTDLKIKKRTKINKTTIIELVEPININRLDQKLGKLSIVGIGPGKAEWQTIEVRKALELADAIFGYQTYIDMVPEHEGQKRFPSDNRVELERAREALDFANMGYHSAIISSGDPGIFAMASAVMEALDQQPDRWPNLQIEILPGLSAMQGAASLVGAPLGHDFAVISLSDILKPFEQIKNRLIAAAEADFVIAIYNPASKTRRHQIEVMKELLLCHKSGETPVLVAKNISRDGEQLNIQTLSSLDSNQIDMSTLLIIGSSKTKVITGPNGRKMIYTPRTYSHEPAE